MPEGDEFPLDRGYGRSETKAEGLLANSLPRTLVVGRMTVAGRERVSE